MLFMEVMQNSEKKNDCKEARRGQAKRPTRCSEDRCPASEVPSPAPAPSLEETLTGFIDELVLICLRFHSTLKEALAQLWCKKMLRIWIQKAGSYENSS